LTFIITNQPSHGTLSGIAPNVTYTPMTDYTGADSFTFKVRAGQVESNEATVTIRVQQANSAPVLIVPGAQSTNAGQPISFTITASDPDTEQRLSFSVSNQPEGASVTQPSATSLRFTWTPAFTQAGIYTANFTVTDNGEPPLSQTKSVTLAVDAKWAKTSGLDRLCRIGWCWRGRLDRSRAKLDNRCQCRLDP